MACPHDGILFGHKKKRGAGACAVAQRNLGTLYRRTAVKEARRCDSMYTERPGEINPPRQSRPVAAGAGCGGAQHTGSCQGPWGFPLRGGDVLEPAEAWLLHVVTVHSATELHARKKLTLGSRSHVWIFYLTIKNDSPATRGPCHLPAVPACPPALPGCPPPHLWPPPSLRQTPLSLPPTLHCHCLPTLRCWAGSST